MLDERVNSPEGYVNATASLLALAKAGLEIIALAMFAVMELDEDKNILPSEYAMAAKKAGLDIIAWSFERSGLNNGGDYYYQYVSDVIKKDGDMYKVLDVLVQKVGISIDWLATVTYYANFFDL